jgi:hypothetical protein
VVAGFDVSKTSLLYLDVKNTTNQPQNSDVSVPQSGVGIMWQEEKSATAVVAKFKEAVEIFAETLT